MKVHWKIDWKTMRLPESDSGGKQQHKTEPILSLGTMSDLDIAQWKDVVAEVNQSNCFGSSPTSRLGTFLLPVGFAFSLHLTICCRGDLRVSVGSSASPRVSCSRLPLLLPVLCAPSLALKPFLEAFGSGVRTLFTFGQCQGGGQNLI